MLNPESPGTWPMTKEIRLNAFDMNCVGHIQHGMWTHPRDRSTEYNTIQYWQDLARLAERGKFDAIFLADIVGVYDVYRGGPAPSIGDAVQIPILASIGNVCAAFCVHVAISSRDLAQLHRRDGGSASWAIGCAAGRLALIRLTTCSISCWSSSVRWPLSSAKSSVRY